MGSDVPLTANTTRLPALCLPFISVLLLAACKKTPATVIEVFTR